MANSAQLLVLLYKLHLSALIPFVPSPPPCNLPLSPGKDVKLLSKGNTKRHLVQNPKYRGDVAGSPTFPNTRMAG